LNLFLAPDQPGPLRNKAHKQLLQAINSHGETKEESNQGIDL
jgi:hypothetical protein